MTITITFDGGAPIVPLLALTDSYATDAESGVVAHSILDGPPVHTLRPASPDEGAVQLLFADETSARDAQAAHKLPAVFEFVDTSRTLLNMRYVVRDKGKISLRLDPATRSRWVVTVPYRVVV